MTVTQWTKTMADVTFDVWPMKSQFTKVRCEPGRAKIAGTYLVRSLGRVLRVIRQFLINKLPLSTTKTVFISGSRDMSSITLMLGFVCCYCFRS